MHRQDRAHPSRRRSLRHLGQEEKGQVCILPRNAPRPFRPRQMVPHHTIRRRDRASEQRCPVSRISIKRSSADDPDCDDSDNEPELDPVLPSPTDALSNDFPARPALLGNLVLQQCNLWLGNSKEGKSSGLHHDFHDNLYILLSGYKRFLLFPPSAHRYLHPRGLVDRVHPNGLIVYAPPGQLPSYIPGRRRPQLPIRPDGLVPSDAARWRRNARLRIKRDIDERPPPTQERAPAAEASAKERQNRPAPKNSPRRPSSRQRQSSASARWTKTVSIPKQTPRTTPTTKMTIAKTKPTWTASLASLPIPTMPSCPVLGRRRRKRHRRRGQR